MRVSVLSAAALAFGLASASIPAAPVSDIPLPETSICEEDLSSVLPTPAPSSKPIHWTTSTILSTSTFTVTKCPPTVTKCPAESVVIETAVITVGTTVCPVSEDVPVPTWTIKKPVGTAPPVWAPEPTKPPVWSSGGLPPKPEPTKAVPVTAGAGRAAVPAMAAVALVAALL
ncbi:hypothetical protein B0T14DRAFT_563324 [Immersiella caudata]|uniref:Uncharacterized protein n=1 Tax=Immersiella caudata TaxID=314043 RepID=A0AA39X582_9PEZI|nr:hypothetical protein B0T14DRAFT_563324 [Immersiella caudata]